MIVINYPEHKPAIKQQAGKEKIFCIIRKAWVSLTPEEWVRQNFLLYLTDVLHYSPSLIAVEKQVLVGHLKKRFDIVVFNNTVAPQMVIECKSLKENLNLGVLEQVLRYNQKLQAPIFVITNGKNCFAFEKQAEKFIALESLPTFNP